MAVKDRVKSFGRCKASQIKPHPQNWRKHPDKQRTAVRQLLNRIGIANVLITYHSQEHDCLMMLDGHLRQSELTGMGDQEVPIIILDVTDDEAKQMLLALDGTAAMAEFDRDVMQQLMEEIESQDQDLLVLVNELEQVAESLENQRHFATHLIDPEELQFHSQNYRTHTREQLEHIKASIEEHGFYRNVVVSADGVILAGHGAVMAARELGLSKIPIILLGYSSDDPKALKILTGDNEIGGRAAIDDRQLTETLKFIRQEDDLLGTGFDDRILTNLAMCTRPRSEVQNQEQAAEWVGMPDYEAGTEVHKLMLSFETEEERDQLISKLGLHVSKPAGSHAAWAAYWPPRAPEDLASLKSE